MGWAMSTPEQVSGKSPRTLCTASVPPVDAPIAMTAAGGKDAAALGAEGGFETSGFTALGRNREILAARILEATLRRSSPTDCGPPGFASTSIAPASNACRAVLLDASPRELITMTGIGR